MKRHWITALGLSAVLVVTLAVGRLVGAQETDKCDGCAGWAELDAKIKDWGGWIDYGKTKNGIVAVAVSPTPEKGSAILTAFQEFDKLTHSEGLKACPMCKDMEKLGHSKGTIIEVVPLKTGAIYLMTSTKPKVVKELHAVYEKGLEQMEKGATTCDHKEGTCTHKGIQKDETIEKEGTEKEIEGN